MKTLLPFLLLGLFAVTARAADPDDQLPQPPDSKTWKLAKASRGQTLFPVF